ncbi:B-cell linker protein [Denticeps clupeoides]|uniref:B-cell linker protein n=1 Tax=Denticeps clupeoides TaxID=299321 RepID=UPI0010A3028D|nr:B-cell linker protein-like [Denticeps clupeoides]
METLNKFTAPATEKLRQLQKIVQDIKKNDDSILNRLKRFQNEQTDVIRKAGRSTLNRIKKNGPPKLPDRDYPGDDEDSGDWSESDDENDTYEVPQQENDDSYEPPPCERTFTPKSSMSFPREEYVGDICHIQPDPASPQPFKPPRTSKPRGAIKATSPDDSLDYVYPEADTDEDTYIQPSEKMPESSSGARSVRDDSFQDEYEVPDNEDSPRTFRPSLNLQAPGLNRPPKASPRNIKKQAAPPPELEADEDYEICDEAEGVSANGSHVSAAPTPMPRQMKQPFPLPKPKITLQARDSQAPPLMKRCPKSLNSEFHRVKFSPLRSKTMPSSTVSADDAVQAAEEKADVYKKPWYVSSCDRKRAEDALLRSSMDGAYLVRQSSGQDAQQPFTLMVYYNGRVFNIPVRFLPAVQKYALGREKSGEERFSCVSHMIENHQRNSLVLIDMQSNTKDSTKLLHPVQF